MNLTSIKANICKISSIILLKYINDGSLKVIV